MENNTTYSVRIPFSETPTVWHPTKQVGPFSTLIRGLFRTVEEAHDWALEHLGYKPVYTIVKYQDLETV